MGRLLTLKQMMNDCQLGTNENEEINKREIEMFDQVVGSLGETSLCILRSNDYFTSFNNLEDFSNNIIDISSHLLNDNQNLKKQIDSRSRIFEDLSKQSQKNAIISLVAHMQRFMPEFREQSMDKNEEDLYKFLCYRGVADPRINTCNGGSIDIRSEIKMALEKASSIAPISVETAKSQINENFLALNHHLKSVSAQLNVDEGWFYIPGLLDTSDVEITEKARENYREYKRIFSEFSSTPVGSLLFSNTLETKGGRFKMLQEDDMFERKPMPGMDTTFRMAEHQYLSPADIDNSIQDVKNIIGSQFARLNFQERINNRTQQEFSQMTQGEGYFVERVRGNRSNWLNGEIGKLVRTNPAATAQVLMNNPERVPLICQAIKKSAEDGSRENGWAETWAHGGMYVGGALMVTGFFAPEGTAIAGISGMIGRIIGAADVLYYGNRAVTKGWAYNSYKMGFFGGSSGSNNMLGIAQEEAQAYEDALIDVSLAIGFSILDFASLIKAKKLVSGADDISQARAVLERSKDLWIDLKNSPVALEKIKKATQSMGLRGKEKLTEYFNLLSTLPSRAKDNIINQLKNSEISIERFKNHIDEFLDRFKRTCAT